MGNRGQIQGGQKSDFGLRQVDYGKLFTPTGITDFTELGSTPGMSGRIRELRYALSFPERTPFENKLPDLTNNKAGGISCAFVPFSEQDFLFAHIQRRRENEKLKNAPTKRPYNQIRFTLLDKEKELRTWFQSGEACFFQLLRQSSDSPLTSPYTLIDYVGEAPRKLKSLDVDLKNPPIMRCLLQKNLSEDDENILQAIFQALITHPGKQVTIISSGASFEQKLLWVQAVQRLIFPFLGWVSFALDYVSAPAQPVRLQFLDTPHDAPLGETVIHINKLPPLSPIVYVKWAIKQYSMDWARTNQIFFNDAFVITTKETKEANYPNRFQLVFHEFFQLFRKPDTSIQDYQDAFTQLTRYIDGGSEDRLRFLCELRKNRPEYESTINSEIIQQLPHTPGERAKVFRSSLAHCLLDATKKIMPFTDWVDNFFLSQPEYVRLAELVKAIIDYGTQGNSLQTVILPYREKLRSLSKEESRSLSSESVLANLKTRTESHFFFTLLDLTNVPIRQTELTFLLGQDESYESWLIEAIKNRVEHATDNLPDNILIAVWNKFVNSSNRQQYYYNGRHCAYDLLRRSLSARPDIISDLIQFSLTLPLSLDKKYNEYVYWVKQLVKISDLSQYPELFSLIDKGPLSLWDASQNISTKEELFLFAVKYRLNSKSRNLLLHEDVLKLVRIEFEDLHHASWSKELLKLAIDSQSVPNDFVIWLLKNNKTHLKFTYLEKIAVSPVWRPFLNTQLTEGDACFWLISITREHRQNYFYGLEDRLYTIAKSCYEQNEKLLLQLIIEVQYLPKYYDKTTEYAYWFDQLDQQKYKIKDPKLRYLKGERGQDVDPFGIEIPFLFLKSVEKAIRWCKHHTRLLPNEDIKRLIDYTIKDTTYLASSLPKPKDAIYNAIELEVVSKNFLDKLLSEESISWRYCKAIIVSSEWNGYHKNISEDTVIKLLQSVPRNQISQFYDEKTDKLYELANKTYRTSTKLLWQIIQYVPTLPDSYALLDQYQYWLARAKSSDSSLREDLNFLITPFSRSSFVEATKNSRFPDELFLLAIESWLEQHKSVSSATKLFDGNDYHFLSVEDIEKLLTLKCIRLITKAANKNLIYWEDIIQSEKLTTPTLLKLLYDFISLPELNLQSEVVWLVLIDLLPRLLRNRVYSQADLIAEYKQWLKIIEKKFSKHPKLGILADATQPLSKVSQYTDEPVLFYVAFNYRRSIELDPSIRSKDNELYAQFEKKYPKLFNDTGLSTNVKQARKKHGIAIFAIVVLCITSGFFLLEDCCQKMAFSSRVVGLLSDFLSPTSTPTATYTPTPTNTPMVKPSTTPTPTPSATPTLSPTPSPTPILAPTNPLACQYVQNEALPLVIEAENYTQNLPGRVDALAYEWRIVDINNQGTAQGVQALPNTSSQIRITNTNISPNLIYQAFIEDPGEYWIYVYGKSGVPEESSNSVYVGIDNQLITINERASESGGITGFVSDKFTWQLYASASVKMTRGWHTFSIWMRENGMIVDRLMFSQTRVLEPGSAILGFDESLVGECTQLTRAPNCPLIYLPGRLEAEDFACPQLIDPWLQTASFNEIDQDPYGDESRPGGDDGPDLETTSDENGGDNLAFTADGEWLKYQIGISEEGTYSFSVRVASEAYSEGRVNGVLILEINGESISTNIPNTGGNQEWQTVQIGDFKLSPGNYILKIVIEMGGFNINYLDVELKEE